MYNPNTSFCLLIYEDALPSTGCIPIHTSIGSGGMDGTLSSPRTGLGHIAAAGGCYIEVVITNHESKLAQATSLPSRPPSSLAHAVDYNH